MKFSRNLINWIFIVLLSCMVSLVITLFSVIFDIFWGEITGKNLVAYDISSNIFIFVLILTVAVLYSVKKLNKKNSNFSLAKHLTILLIIIKFGKKYRENTIKEIIIFNGILLFSLYFLIGTFIEATFSIVYIFSYKSFIIFVISFLFSFFIYSEMSFNEVDRIVRQIYLWLITLSILIFFTTIQINYLFEDISNSQNQLNITILMLGLLFNISHVIEKVRLYFKIIFKKNKKDIIKYKKAL